MLLKILRTQKQYSPNTNPKQYMISVVVSIHFLVWNSMEPIEKNKIKTTVYRLFRQPTMHRNMNLNQFLKLQLKQKKKVYSRNSMNRTSSNKWNLNLVLPEENNKNKTMAWKMKVIFSILPKKLLKKSLYVTRGRNNLNKLRRSELIIYNLYLNLNMIKQCNSYFPCPHRRSLKFKAFYE